MIRHTEHTFLNGEYEVYDGELIVGKALVDEGIIIQLQVHNGIEEDYRGEILYKLLESICMDANHMNANLSIMIPSMKTQRLKRFLERFQFEETHANIFKRLAGSSVPPSVIY